MSFVVAVMLVSRPALAKRAAESFRENHRHFPASALVQHPGNDEPLCHQMNAANEAALRLFPRATHIAKWDDDDWSYPQRLIDQMKLMRQTGASAVGYHSMPFYEPETGEVRIYSNPTVSYALGTSLLMKRESWERHRFPDTTKRSNNAAGRGSDTLLWLTLANRESVCSVPGFVDYEPRMIARVSRATWPTVQRMPPAAPSLAARVREIMEGK